jgi:hypothetical protein
MNDLPVFQDHYWTATTFNRFRTPFDDHLHKKQNGNAEEAEKTTNLLDK